MKIISLIFLTCILCAACNSLEEKLEGTWAIDQAYYHNEPVTWDLYSNAIGLKENNACSLPIGDWIDRHTDKENGIWKAFKKNGKAYLQINTENRIFDRTFEVHNLKKVRDSVSWGYLMKMTLIADSLKMDCTKALYE